MQYEKALKLWGANKLNAHYAGRRGLIARPEDVRVEMTFDEGYACCGGTDPNCYCSFAESPSAQVTITAPGMRTDISHYQFDFATILWEIVEAADGAITK